MSREIKITQLDFKRNKINPLAIISKSSLNSLINLSLPTDEYLSVEHFDINDFIEAEDMVRTTFSSSGKQALTILDCDFYDNEGSMFLVGVTPNGRISKSQLIIIWKPSGHVAYYETKYPGKKITIPVAEELLSWFIRENRLLNTDQAYAKKHLVGLKRRSELLNKWGLMFETIGSSKIIKDILTQPSG